MGLGLFGSVFLAIAREDQTRESETKKLPVPVLKAKKRSQNLTPVLVIISGNSLVFSTLTTHTP